MKHFVTITTPMLTVDEVVRQYGVSKADQRFVASLFERKSSRLSKTPANKLRSGRARLTANNIEMASSKTRKTTRIACKVA